MEDKQEYKFVALGVMAVVAMSFIGICDIGLIIIVAFMAAGITLVMLEIILGLLLSAIIFILLESAMITVICDKKISIKNYRVILSANIESVVCVEKRQNIRVPFILHLNDPMEHYNRITKRTKKSKQMRISLFPSSQLEEILEKFFPDEKVSWTNIEL